MTEDLQSPGFHQQLSSFRGGQFALSNSRCSFLGLSQVFRVDVARATAVRLVSAPAAGGTYRAGETIRIEADFSEPLAVRGAPGLAVNIRRPDGTEGAFEAVYAGIERPLAAPRSGQ